MGWPALVARLRRIRRNLRRLWAQASCPRATSAMGTPSTRTAMLGKRRKTPLRGAAQDAAAPEGTDLKTGKAYLNEA